MDTACQAMKLLPEGLAPGRSCRPGSVVLVEECTDAGISESLFPARQRPSGRANQLLQPKVTHGRRRRQSLHLGIRNVDKVLAHTLLPVTPGDLGNDPKQPRGGRPGDGADRLWYR